MDNIPKECQSNRDSTIFVQIACYRDPECKNTIHDLFTKAVFPERIFVGLNWQYAEEDADLPYRDNPYKERIRIVKYHYTKSKGYCWALSVSETLYDGEDFILNSDSHMRFIPGWDVRMIDLYNQLVAAGHPKPAITYYPPSYTIPGANFDEIISKMAPRPLVVNGINMGIFINSRVIKFMPGGQPYIHPIVAGGFLFTSNSIISDVPYDPHLYFYGEEITVAARLWTRGYDMFHPSCILAYHLYRRQRNPQSGEKNYRSVGRHQGQHADTKELENLAYKRVRHILGSELSSDPKVIQAVEKYGLGTLRTLYQFSRFAGLDFQTVTTRPFTKLSVYFPERLPLGSIEEIKILNAAEVKSTKVGQSKKVEILSSLLSATKAKSLLDLGSLYSDAIPNIDDHLRPEYYSSFTVSYQRACLVRQHLQGKPGCFTAQMNYAAEALPCCELASVGTHFSHAPTRLIWQLLDSIRFGKSRYLCVVENNRTASALSSAPFFLPEPNFAIPHDGELTSYIWDLTKLPNLFEALPERESRARRIILDNLISAVATIKPLFAGHLELFHRLVTASCNVARLEAEKVFNDPLIVQLVAAGGEKARVALDLWWSLRRFNFNVVRNRVQHPLLNDSLKVSYLFMQAVSWEYFEELSRHMNLC
jgi:hypothetical protein